MNRVKKRRKLNRKTSKRPVRSVAPQAAPPKMSRKQKVDTDPALLASVPANSIRTPLRIPYGNKEVALKLGARYGSEGWYAPPGVDLSAFGERAGCFRWRNEDSIYLQSEPDARPEVRRSEGQCRGSDPSGRWTITAADPAMSPLGSPAHVLRVECVRCFRIAEIRKADAIRSTGHIRLEGCRQRLLDRTCTNLTGPRGRRMLARLAQISRWRLEQVEPTAVPISQTDRDQQHDCRKLFLSMT